MSAFPLRRCLVGANVTGLTARWGASGLIFIPLVNIVVAKAFGKSGVFGFFGLFLFSIIGYLILGFGQARYTAPPVPCSALPSGRLPGCRTCDDTGVVFSRNTCQTTSHRGGPRS